VADDHHRLAILDELSRLATDLGPVLNQSGDQELLSSIVETARWVFDAAACSLAVLSDDESVLHFRAASGEGAEAVVGMRIPADSGIAGWAVMSGQSIAIDDVRQDPRFAAEVAERTGYVPAAIMAMPLETEQQTVGVIEVLDRRRGGADGADDLELLALFARQAALAIETSRRFSNLGQTLLDALASSAGDGDLRAALRRQANEARAPRADLAELSLLINDIGQLGPEERTTVTRLAAEFLAYARKQRR